MKRVFDMDPIEILGMTFGELGELTDYDICVTRERLRVVMDRILDDGPLGYTSNSREIRRRTEYNYASEADFRLLEEQWNREDARECDEADEAFRVYFLEKCGIDVPDLEDACMSENEEALYWELREYWEDTVWHKGENENG